LGSKEGIYGEEARNSHELTSSLKLTNDCGFEYVLAGADEMPTWILGGWYTLELYETYFVKFG